MSELRTLKDFPKEVIGIEDKMIRDTIERKVEREQNLQQYRDIEVPLEIKHQIMQNENQMS